MEYIFNRDGVPEKVAVERWAWFARYKLTEEEKAKGDLAKQINQFGADGIFHQFGEIDQDNVEVFGMYKVEDPTKRIEIVKTPEMKLFHFYRNNIVQGEAGGRYRTYCFGWETTQDCKPKTHIFITHDDNIVMSNTNINFQY